MSEQEAQVAQAVERGLRYLDSRGHGERELYGKLCRRFDEQTAAAALAQLKELGLVDDVQFAQNRAESLAAKGKSGYMIRCGLLQLGISRDVVDGAMDNLELDERRAALRLVQRQYMDKLRRGEEQKVMAALARRGFSGGDIIAAVREGRHQLEETEPPE